MIQEAKLHALLQRQQQRWEEIRYHMEHLEENPMVMITEVFKKGDLFLAERLKQEGDLVLYEAHQYWMSYLLPTLTEYFSMDDIELLYDPETALSHIYIKRGEQTIAHFSPYWRFFETYETPGKSNYIQVRNQLSIEVTELMNELEHAYNVAENPALIGEDDTWGYAKALVNPKKHRNKMLEECQKLEERIEEIKNEIQRLDSRMEYEEREYLETSYCLDKLKRKVERWGDFTFIEPEEGELV